MESQDNLRTSTDIELILPMPDSISKEANKMDAASYCLVEDLNENTKNNADVKKRTSLLEDCFSQLSEEKNNNVSLDTEQQSCRSHVTNTDLVYLSTLETNEEKVEGLEKEKKSIDTWIGLAVESNDKAKNENYEEQEEINKESKEEMQLNDRKILLANDSKVITKSEEDVSRETNGTFSHVCFCTSDLSLLGEGLTAELEECHHTICSGCMTQLLKSIIEDIIVEPRCPHINDGTKCNSLIQEHQIRELVETNLYEEYLEKCIKKVKEDAGNNILYCQKPTCKAWYIKEDNVEVFWCVYCKEKNYLPIIQVNEKPEENITDSDEYVLAERYNEMLLLSESDVVPNFESFECPICFVQYAPQEGLTLKNCLHTFCKTCIANVILHSDDADIKCPYKNDAYSCDEAILQSEIRAVIKPNDFQKYLEKSIAQVEKKAGKSAFHCKTPNCPGWCFYELGVDNFLCPTCNEDNCFLCNKIHTGRGCVDETISGKPETISKESSELITIMLKNGTALLCPTCSTVITKDDGCDAIICTACKTEICWVTRGPRWGPKGRGDTSGGCKCSPPARCHPNCRNCH